MFGVRFSIRFLMIATTLVAFVFFLDYQVEQKMVECCSKENSCNLLACNHTGKNGESTSFANFSYSNNTTWVDRLRFRRSVSVAYWKYVDKGRVSKVYVCSCNWRIGLGGVETEELSEEFGMSLN